MTDDAKHPEERPGVWESYLRAGLPPPTDAHRARLEALVGATLPDGYWALVREHGGDVLNLDAVALPEDEKVNVGVLLLAVPPEKAGSSASYCVEWCFANLRSDTPAGILPFADDTGGNYWAFDFREDRAAPRIVFVDHELEGERGVSPAAPDFDTFLADAGVPR